MKWNSAFRMLLAGGLLGAWVTGCAPEKPATVAQERNTGTLSSTKGIPNPVYQGRKLSDWMQDSDRPGPPENEAMAAEAVRHIGAAALPMSIDYISAARWGKFKVELQEWRAQQPSESGESSRPLCPRAEGLAALDALAPVAAEALPALKQLLAEDPPDHRALYVIARIGPPGVPLLTGCLHNTNRVISLGAQACLDMMASHSEVLYPPVPVGPDAPSFQRQICEFNIQILSAASAAYRAEHPRPESPAAPFDRPLPSVPDQ